MGKRKGGQQGQQEGGTDHRKTPAIDGGKAEDYSPVSKLKRARQHALAGPFLYQAAISSAAW
jgi:hypothetical protein